MTKRNTKTTDESRYNQFKDDMKRSVASVLSGGRCAGCLYEGRPFSPFEASKLTIQHFLPDHLKREQVRPILESMPELLREIETDFGSIDENPIQNVQNTALVCPSHHDPFDQHISSRVPTDGNTTPHLEDFWLSRYHIFKKWRRQLDVNDELQGLSKLPHRRVLDIWTLKTLARALIERTSKHQEGIPPSPDIIINNAQQDLNYLLHTNRIVPPEVLELCDEYTKATAGTSVKTEVTEYALARGYSENEVSNMFDWNRCFASCILSALSTHPSDTWISARQFSLLAILARGDAERRIYDDLGKSLYNFVNVGVVDPLVDLQGRVSIIFDELRTMAKTLNTINVVSLMRHRSGKALFFDFPDFTSDVKFYKRVAQFWRLIHDALLDKESRTRSILQKALVETEMYDEIQESVQLVAECCQDLERSMATTRGDHIGEGAETLTNLAVIVDVTIGGMKREFLNRIHTSWMKAYPSADCVIGCTGG